MHIHPVIDDWWKGMQETMFSDVGDIWPSAERAIALSVDGRADSPGFSVQYCLYSFILLVILKLYLDLVKQQDFKSVR